MADVGKPGSKSVSIAAAAAAEARGCGNMNGSGGVTDNNDVVLHEKVAACKYMQSQRSHKGVLLLRTAAYLLFLRYRATSVLAHYYNQYHHHQHHHPCNHHIHGSGLGLALLALTCELWLGLTSHLGLITRLFPVERAAYPDRLISFLRSSEAALPRVDVFVTTADPLKEPPIITVNTVLSVLALDYPDPGANLACYVSDDGASLLTLWSILQAATFSHTWVTFCHTFHVMPRAPGPYFRHVGHHPRHRDPDWQTMKAQYEALQKHITSMTVEYDKDKDKTSQVLLEEIKTKIPEFEWQLDHDVKNHQAIFEVILPSKSIEPNGEGYTHVPKLVYIAREKHPKHKHHFKAGAMNALTRVSAITTNAPYILNLDCDVYVNDPKALLYAMCFFIDPRTSYDTGFVQFPQAFDGVDEDDIYGNNMTAGMAVFLRGIDGLQGAIYCGTNCVFRRQSLYERISPTTWKVNDIGTNGDALNYEEIMSKFGSSFSLCHSCVANIRNDKWHLTSNLLAQQVEFKKEAKKLMSCTYEDGTQWGKKIGWIYGSTTEDLMTGQSIHGRGWKSILYSPSPPSFLGGFPTSSEDALTTRKRWTMGMLEVLFGPQSPLLFNKNGGLTLLQRIAYIWCFTLPLVCFPLMTYSTLPALSIILETSLLPKVNSTSMMVPLGLFLCIYGASYYENILVDVGVKEWWNTERMESISSISSYVFAVFDVFKKLMGLSDTITFVLTPKNAKVLQFNELTSKAQEYIQDNDHYIANETITKNENVGFVVNSTSPLFIPPTTIVLLNLLAIVIGLVRRGGSLTKLLEDLGGEFFCVLWVLFVLWPFVKGMAYFVFKKGPLALRTSTIVYSSIIVGSFIFILNVIL